MRVRNACLHDLAQRTGLPAPQTPQLDNVAVTAGLGEAWDWWCAVCVREPVIGEAGYVAGRRRVSLLLRAGVITALILFALAVSAAPAGS